MVDTSVEFNSIVQITAHAVEISVINDTVINSKTRPLLATTNVGEMDKLKILSSLFGIH